MAHAILSPSSASRWLMCTKSARLESKFKDTTSAAAAEGTLAHAIAEVRLYHLLGNMGEKSYNKALAVYTADPLFQDEMIGHVDEYANFVMEQYAEAQKLSKDAVIFLEQKLNLTDYVPEGFGTGDVGIVADELAIVCDFKYGSGVKISALSNKQMMLYALGWLREFEHLYDIKRIRMLIYQPRIENYSTWEIDVAELKHWADTELKVKAELAFKGEGEYVAGDHCRFCKAKATCKAFADYNLETVKDVKDPNLLTPAEIANIITKAPTFLQFIEAVKGYALEEAIAGNLKLPGYKLVAGKSNRVFTDEAAVAKALTDEGFAEDKIYSPKELLGITAIEKLTGKKGFNTLLGEWVHKPVGKPTLAEADDKRAEWNSAVTAFAGIETD